MIPALLASPLVPFDRDASAATATLDVDAGERVFAGHYPGFPVLPGVCLINTVQRAAKMMRPAQALRIELAAVESARFIEPVFPGDRMIVALHWMRLDGAGDWRCSATIHVRDKKVSMVRLRYAGGETA